MDHKRTSIRIRVLKETLNYEADHKLKPAMWSVKSTETTFVLVLKYYNSITMTVQYNFPTRPQSIQGDTHEQKLKFRELSSYSANS